MAAPPPPPPPPAAEAAPPFTAVAAEAEFERLADEEQQWELELEKLYSRASHLCQSESRNLAYVSEQHKQVPAAIRKLQESLQQTSVVADELSERVRKLDTAKERIGEALKLVQELLELRECADHVNKAISAEDLEQAARYVSRFRAMKDDLPPGADDASVRVLQDAESQLCALVRKRFEEAMKARDKEGVSRFAKLFHPLGLSSEGVLKYVEFIRRSMAEKCSQSIRLLAPSTRRGNQEPNPYSNALMGVFVSIADIVQEHREEVETEFGADNFLVALRGLLEEADVQGLKVVEKFEADNKAAFDDDSSCSTEDANTVLTEICMIIKCTMQFKTYIEGVGAGVVELVADRASFVEQLPEGHSRDHGLPNEAAIVHRIQVLTGQYVQMEQRFLHQCVQQAWADGDTLDTDDVDAQTTTMVDDAFFILMQSMQRAISTSDVTAVCAVVNWVADAIQNQLKQALSNNLSDSKGEYSAFVQVLENLAPPLGGAHPLAKLFENASSRGLPVSAAVSWPHALNNLQLCGEYIEKLKIDAQAQFDEFFPEDGPDADKRVMFEQCVAALDGAKSDLQSTHALKCKEGVLLFRSHLSKELRPLEQLNYNINEAQYEDFKVNDPWASAFVSQAEVVYQSLKLVLCGPSCDECMQHLAELACKGIEGRVMKKEERFSMYGALYFDSEVRMVLSFFTRCSEQALRHKFTKLLEMASFLTLEDGEELREMLRESANFRCTNEEIRKLLVSRTDFDLSEAELEMMLPNSS